MKKGLTKLWNLSLIYVLAGSLALSAEPFQQNHNASDKASSIEVINDAGNTQTPAGSSSGTAIAPIIDQLPDAPVPSQPDPQNQSYSSSAQQQQKENDNEVPSGTAAAKAPIVKGAPASRTVGAAIAPAKQKQRRSLLVKTGLLVGACVAVGSAFALSKASPSKPPGAP